MKRIINSIFLIIFATLLFSCKNTVDEQIPSVELKMPGTITNGRYALDNKRFSVELIQDDKVVSSNFAFSGEAVYFYLIDPGFYKLKIQVFDISDVENEYLEYFGESEQFEVVAGKTTDVTVTLKYVAEKKVDPEEPIDDDKDDDNKPEDPVDDDNTGDDVVIKINNFYKYDDSSSHIISNGKNRYINDYKISTDIAEGSTIVLNIKGTSKLPNLYAQFVPTDVNNNVHNLYFQHNSYYEFSLGEDNQSWEIILPINFVKFYEYAKVTGTSLVDNVPENSKYDTIQLFFDYDGEISNVDIFNQSLDVSMEIKVYTPEEKHLEFLRSVNYDDSTKYAYPYRFYIDYIIEKEEVEKLTYLNRYKFKINGTLKNEISDKTMVNLLKNDGSYGTPYSRAVSFNLKETNISSEFDFNYVDSVILQITVPCTKEKLPKHISIENFGYSFEEVD